MLPARAGLVDLCGAQGADLQEVLFEKLTALDGSIQEQAKRKIGYRYASERVSMVKSVNKTG
jgi:hypothetical protein